ncbi:hypothetical protein [Sulfuricystis multivorans]|uniref:hypothetical protein n=1 Tax=Sulfuricystis multivorans TaxID=2211108 RepID=UPI000F8342A2|nr:hypothetical protein [Sulfuricystis multivorans]
MMRRAFFPVRFLLALMVMLASSFASATNYPAKIQRIDLEGGAALYAINDGPATLKISLELTNSINVSSDQAWPVTTTIPPHSQKTLAFLFPSNPGIPFQWDFKPTVTVSSVTNDSAAPAGSSASGKDIREEAQAELRRLLEPAARMSMKLSGKPWLGGDGAAKPATGQTINDALPFLLRAYALFLSITLGARLLAALRMKNWARAAVTFMAAATIEYGVLFYLGADFIDLRSWHIEGFKAFAMHHEWSVPILAGVLITCWATAYFLLHEDMDRTVYQDWPPNPRDARNTVYYKPKTDKIG